MAKFDHLAIDNSEIREIVKELNRYGKKDVLKRCVHLIER